MHLTIISSRGIITKARFLFHFHGWDFFWVQPKLWEKTERRFAIAVWCSWAWLLTLHHLTLVWRQTPGPHTGHQQWAVRNVAWSSQVFWSVAVQGMCCDDIFFHMCFVVVGVLWHYSQPHTFAVASVEVGASAMFKSHRTFKHLGSLTRRREVSVHEFV